MIAIVCPGQGSQKPGFLTDWLALDGVRAHLGRLSEAAGLDLVHFGTEADEETIKDTAVAQPLIVAAGLVAGRLLADRLGAERAKLLMLTGDLIDGKTAASMGLVARSVPADELDAAVDGE